MKRSDLSFRVVTLGALVGGLMAAMPPARAEIPDNAIKIGVLNDLSGPFADHSGRGAIVAAQMAAEDFAKEAPELKVTIISADHQNKPDIGATIVRSWVDRDGVAAVADVPNSAVGLAVNQIMREKNHAFIATNVATSALTLQFCSPDTVQWTMDTWADGNAAARALAGEGGDTWYFLTVDYALGQALQKDTTDALGRLGAKVLGSVRHPLGATDFSSYLLQAQASGAKVIALANTGSDLVNAMKQAREFGLTRDHVFVGLLTQLADVDAMGLEVAQGMIVTEGYYWNLNDATRDWAMRWSARMAGRMPTANQAGVYSSVLAYLRAAKRAGTLDGGAVVAEMGKSEIDDPLFGPVTIRPDGRAVHAMHVFRVKTPAESKSRWDVYERIATVPPAQAFRPMDTEACKLSKRT